MTKTGKGIQRSRGAGAKGFPASVIDKLTSYNGQNILKFLKDGLVNDAESATLFLLP